MSTTHEVRPTTKWSAIRSKAVPSNVMHPVSDSLSVRAMMADGMDKSDKLERTSKANRTKPVLPAKLHKPPAFAGSTGSSHL